MKKISMIAIILIVLGGLFLANEGKEVREIRTEIEINAPIEKVWSTLMAIDKWQDWSPIIKRASGSASLGSTLNITMISEAGKEGADGPNYEPIITDFNEPTYFRFSTEMMAGFIFTNNKIFKLEKTNSSTKLIHIEQFSGMMTPIMWGKVQENVPAMLNSMNEALKVLVEKGSN